MKKTRRRYDRKFKISVVAELESGKPLAQIAREYGIHPSLTSCGRDEPTENPKKRSAAMAGNRCKNDAWIAELETARLANFLPVLTSKLQAAGYSLKGIRGNVADIPRFKCVFLEKRHRGTEAIISAGPTHLTQRRAFKFTHIKWRGVYYCNWFHFSWFHYYFQ